MMGTIYRHNITANELNQLIKMIPGREIDDKADYENEFCSDIKYADLFRLYSLRGMKQEAQFYFNKIKDDTLKFLLKK